MQFTLYLLGSCLLAGTALLLYGTKHAPVGTETEDGFVPAPAAGDAKTAGGLRLPLAATRTGIRSRWEPLVRT